MLRFKPEVRIGYLNECLGVAIQAACLWSMRNRIDVEINSINDGPGVHLATSLHYYDLAIDFDTVGDKPAETQQLGEFLRVALPPGYDVLYEGDHIHVEYDMKRPALLRRA